MVIIEQKTLREKVAIDVMTQLKASVLKAHGREDGPEMEATAGAVDEPNAGAVLRAAMAVTALGPGGGAPGDVDDDATLTLLSQRPMMFQDSEVEMQDRVARWGWRLMTLMTMTYRQDISRSCATSGIARTLTFSVGRCWGTRLCVWSL